MRINFNVIATILKEIFLFFILHSIWRPTLIIHLYIKYHRGAILTVKFPISKLQNKKIQRWVVQEFTCITVPSKNKITHLHLHPFFSLTNCPKLNAGGGSGPVRVIVRYN